MNARRFPVTGESNEKHKKPAKMCRSVSNYEQFKKVKDHIRIKGFYLRLSTSTDECLVPETLTLVYLPRNRGPLLEINGSQIKSSSGAFMVLHRAKSPENEADFTNTEFVRASDGTCFEIYIRSEKIVSGSFRREEKGWRMECRCGLEEPSCSGVSSVEVCVAGEGGLVVKEMVEMSVRKKRRVFTGMEDIPEEIEESCDCGEVICRGYGDENEGEKEERLVEAEMEMEMEESLMKWVDLGIYVGAAVCLGVGCLVSAAASKRLRRLI